MTLFLWIGALLPCVSSNAYFDNLEVGWRSPDVVYRIGDISNLSVKEHHIKEALTWFTENTCVNFIDQKDASGKAVDLTIQKNADYDNCEYIGQGIFEIGECIGSRGYIIHETMHFLGFYHTQYRPDWRDYMTVLPGYTHNFDSPTCKAVPGVKYDYGSVMHYAIPGVKLVDDQFLPTMGQSVRVPFSDAQSINWLFNCTGKCTTQPKCMNGGYTHPRDCNKCACNKYYTGSLCETPRNLVKLSCEGARTHYREIRVAGNATLKKQRLLQDDFFNHGDDLWDIVEAPQNTQIRVEIKSWAARGTPLPAVKCSLYSVEINDGDLNMVGKMFCDSWALGNNVWHNFTATSNRLGLHMEYASETATTLIASLSLLGCDGALPPTTTTTTVA